MTSCGNCHTSWVGDQEFCKKCGASCLPGVVTAANVLGSTDKPVGPGAGGKAGHPGLAANVAGALCYAFGLVSGIVFLVLAPYKKIQFVRFHAWQSIYFSVFWVVFTVVWTTLVLIFEAVTGGFLISLIIPIDCLLTLAAIGCWVWLMYRAYLGEQTRIPIVGGLARRHAGR